MSDNYVFYAAKMLELKAARERNRPLYRQLTELFEFVLQCEARWGHDYFARGREDSHPEVHR